MTLTDVESDMITRFSAEHIYDIMELLMENYRIRGAIIVYCSEHDPIGMMFVRRPALTKLVGDTKPVEYLHLLDVTKKYDMAKEVVLCFVDADTRQHIKTAIAHLDFIPIKIRTP